MEDRANIVQQFGEFISPMKHDRISSKIKVDAIPPPLRSYPEIDKRTVLVEQVSDM